MIKVDYASRFYEKFGKHLADVLDLEKTNQANNQPVDPSKLIMGDNRTILCFRAIIENPKTNNQQFIEWSTTPNKQIRVSALCPALTKTHQAIIPGFNDLTTVYNSRHPDIPIETIWDYEGNSKEFGISSPDGITATRSDTKYNFICSCKDCNNKFKLSPKDIIQRQYPYCNECNAKLRYSFPEVALYYYVQKAFPNSTVLLADRSTGRELDVFLPEEKIAFEYDGSPWHSEKRLNSDLSKNQLCADLGVMLYRIRERGCPRMDSVPDSLEVIIREGDTTGALNSALSALFSKLRVAVDIDVGRDENEIKQYLTLKEVDNSIESCIPNIGNVWSDDNGTVKPNQISIASHKTIHLDIPFVNEEKREYCIVKRVGEANKLLHNRSNGYSISEQSIEGYSPVPDVPIARLESEGYAFVGYYQIKKHMQFTPIQYGTDIEEHPTTTVKDSAGCPNVEVWSPKAASKMKSKNRDDFIR